MLTFKETKAIEKSAYASLPNSSEDGNNWVNNQWKQLKS
jgi:hypothetical protein